ncbi:MAG: tRNA lysidine(34) synthetase TilS [Chloroflexi bacterium RBG_13_51_52]|nr:MAG: tRNA lysidine(34) synthetase TilS [Chloroflexi bacterium RBG_13_51_52]
MKTGKNSGLEQKVLAYLREKKLVSPGERLVVAVSGGPDSVCLLYILSSLQKELGLELHVAHLNHQLRGKESAVDAKYVARLAKRLGISATIASRDVKSYWQQRRLSLEEAAREVRYSFLAAVAQEEGAVKVAVGHTSDDHIETVLMHLIRGSGTRGLRGLLPVNKLKVSGNSLTVIRPLLCLSRQDTIAYCRAHKLKPRLDASNLAPQPLRNKVRHHLLPELRKYNPQIDRALFRLSRTASDDFDFVEAEARRLMKNIIKRDKNSVVINKKSFLALTPALQRHLLRLSIESLLGNLKDIEAGHIEDIIEALAKPAGKVIGLPFGINFTIEYDRYVVSPDSLSLCPFPALEGEMDLKITGKTVFSGWEVDAAVIEPSAFKSRGGEINDFSACFDLDRAGNKLAVRRRLPGDRFQPLGMENLKKINIFMIDARIPQAWRRRVPIVCAGNNILWVVGWRIDDHYKVRPDTKNVLLLEFKRT